MSNPGINAVIKKMDLVHKSMLCVLLLFGVAAVVLVQMGQLQQGLQPFDHELQLACLALSFGGFFLGGAIFKKRIRQQQISIDPPQIKIAAYRSATLLQWALVEAPAMFSIVCFMLVGNYAFLALALVFTSFLAVNGPNKLKMLLLLRLKDEDMNASQ